MFKKLIISLLALTFAFFSCSDEDITGTGDTVAPAAVSDLTVVTFANNSLELSWTAPGDDGNSGTAEEYDLRYSTTPIISESVWGSATTISNEPTPLAAGELDSLEISGLAQDMTYYFAIKSVDETGNWSELSNIASGTTTPDTIMPATIADLEIVDVTSYGAVLIWTSPGDDDTIGTAARYDIKCDTTAISSINWGTATSCSGIPTPSAAGGTDTIKISGLKSNTHYFFAARASDEQGNWSEVSNNVDTVTENVAIITDLTVIDSARSAITLAWTAPGDTADGPYYQYDIRYSTSVIDSSNWSQATQCIFEPTPGTAGMPDTFQITGLRYDTTHYFAIKSADSASNWSAISNVPPGKTKWTHFAYPENYPTGYGPSCIISAHLNSSDTCPDMVVVNSNDNNIMVYLCQGNAATYDVDYGPRTVCAADFDGDTYIDLAVGHLYDSSEVISILFNNGSGLFGDTTNYGVGYNTASLISFDFDGDNDNDIVAACIESDSIFILVNNGDGTFTDTVRNYISVAVGDGPYGLTSGDLDNDGDSDLVVSNYNSDNISVLFYNSTDSTYTPTVNYNVGNGPTSIFLSEFNGDAYLDLAVVNTVSNNIHIMLNNGDSSFSAGTPYTAGDGPRSVFASDLNNDTYNDLAVANINSDSVSVFLGSGDGTFQPAINYWAGEGPISVVADFVNDDAYRDLAVANNRSKNFSILRNMTGTK